MATSSSSVEWALPGKVLLIDDKYEDVKGFVEALLEKGIAVHFWNSKTDPNQSFRNIRVVVIDLDLTGSQVRGDISYYSPAVNALTKVSPPFLVIILSKDFINEDLKFLKEAYMEFTGKPLEAFMADKGFQKQPDYEDLIATIRSNIERRKVLNLILKWENLLDSAKDKALAEFTKEEIEEGMLALIKSMFDDDMGRGSLTREFVTNMTRLVSRYMNSGSHHEELKQILDILSTEASSKTFSSENQLLPYLQMFYNVSEAEGMWTGDIYKSIYLNSYWNYAILLTPACDIAQNKADHLLFAQAFSITQAGLRDPEHPIYKLKNKTIKKYYDELIVEKDDAKKDLIASKTFKEFKSLRGKNLPESLCILWNFRENDSTNFIGLCISFQRVMHVTKDEIVERGWKRICRLDSPFIEDALQRYGAHSTRLGIPGVNTPNF